MSKLMDIIQKDELTGKKKISEEVYKKAKETLDEEAFKADYYTKGDEYAPEYYQRTHKEVKLEELDIYMLYEILKEQRKTAKRTLVSMIFIIIIAIPVIIAFIRLLSASIQGLI